MLEIGVSVGRISSRPPWSGVVAEAMRAEGVPPTLLEVLEDRYERAATIITSQLSSKTWHAALGDPTIADAICDRLVHNAHVLKLGGPSLRRKQALQSEKPATPNPS